MGVAGAESLASYLIQRPNNSLDTLRLSYNQVSDDGVRAFAEALMVNNALLILTLKSNKINEYGLVSLGNALFHNNTLELLTVLGNNFTDASGKLFGELARDKLPYVNLWIDVQVYIVDGVHYVAESR